MTTNTGGPVKVALVDDHTLFRQGLAMLLGSSGTVEIIFDAKNGEEMMSMLKTRGIPDVILTDIHMPAMNGFQVTSWLRQNYPEIKVMALTMFEDDRSIITMLRNGACGYILKETRGSELIAAIRAVKDTGVYLNELVTGKMLRSLQNTTLQQLTDKFSANERRFLELSCSELTYKEIADQMNLSPHTIENYREALFTEFGIRSRTGLVLFAIRNGLIKV